MEYTHKYIRVLHLQIQPTPYNQVNLWQHKDVTVVNMVLKVGTCFQIMFLEQIGNAL